MIKSGKIQYNEAILRTLSGTNRTVSQFNNIRENVNMDLDNFRNIDSKNRTATQSSIIQLMTFYKIVISYGLKLYILHCDDISLDKFVDQLKDCYDENDIKKCISYIHKLLVGV